MNNSKSFLESELAHYVKERDAQDTLKSFRDEFYFPKINGKESIYFCGNSLGLQPKSAATAIEKELADWKNYGVEGHFSGENPWLTYHKNLQQPLASITGAKLHEVVAMNSLTTNLHLLMVSFYRPSAERFKIIIEAGAFPSDQYAVESQVKFHGFDPNQAIVELHPEEGEDCIKHEKIIETIQQHRDELALVLLPGVQYYTGQVFNIPEITKEAHKAGAFVGFDLAHAVGNILLELHHWEVDFAVWCSYKYLNSGPGNVGGAFVHEKHGNSPDIPRFAGWWGHREDRRFMMEKGFEPIEGADGWQLSNANVFPLAIQWAALKVIENAGMHQLHAKSTELTGFLMEWLFKIDPSQKKIKILTPTNPEERGCQVSLFIPENGKLLFDKINQAGFIVDWREPNVIRVAPTPLYNNFSEVLEFLKLIHANLDNL